MKGNWLNEDTFVAADNRPFAGTAYVGKPSALIAYFGRPFAEVASVVKPFAEVASVVKPFAEPAYHIYAEVLRVDLDTFQLD